MKLSSWLIKWGAMLSHSSSPSFPCAIPLTIFIRLRSLPQKSYCLPTLPFLISRSCLREPTILNPLNSLVPGCSRFCILNLICCRTVKIGMRERKCKSNQTYESNYNYSIVPQPLAYGHRVLQDIHQSRNPESPPQRKWKVCDLNGRAIPRESQRSLLREKLARENQ